MTTLSTLQTGLAPFQTIMLIEGLQYAITDGSTSAAVTALSGTEWSSVIGGLQAQLAIKQRLVPWSPEVDIHSLTVVVQPDESDTLGVLMFANNSGEETLLAAAIDCNDTTITVKSTADFASSGSIHIGTEHITYTGTTATTFTGCTRGRYAPFKANTETPQRFGRPHPLAAVGDGYVVQARVTSLQRTWIGRWVGIWLHAKSGSTLDTLADAHLVFAGRIVGMRDETNGLAYLELESAAGVLRDCVLLRDQWNARVAEGIIIRAGERFSANDQQGATIATANDLVVVESGASGANQMNAGRYTLDTLADALNGWFASEKTATRLLFSWTWQPRFIDKRNGRLKSQMRVVMSSSTNNSFQFGTSDDIMEFMGYTSGRMGSRIGVGNDGEFGYISESTPCRTLMRTGGETTIEIENVRGTWWNNQPYFPMNLGTDNLPAGSFAALQIGEDGALVIAKEGTPGSTISTAITNSTALSDIFHGHGNFYNILGIGQYRRILETEEGDIKMKQVAVIKGDFSDLLTKFLASTGTSGYNHATWDVFTDQLSAGVPWQLLGSGWTESADHLAESGTEVAVVLEKPTKLVEVVGPDLVARMASVVWKNQTLRLATWSLPAAAVSQHTLTEANKASAADASDDQRTVANESDEYLVNSVKLLYNRQMDSKGAYRSALNITDKTSQYDTGMQRPVQVELRNCYEGFGSAQSSIERIADSLGSTMGIFSKPMRIIRRTISPEFYAGMAPGDVCVVSDDFVRDSATGARGISTRAGMIISHEIDYGGYEIDTGKIRPMLGQVNILLWPRDNIVAYSPCAQVDNTASNGGYNSGTQTLTFYAHEHSTTNQSVDVSHFAAGDAVRVIQIDPDDPAAAQTWTTTISSVNTGANTATLGSALTGWSSSLRYRMISDNWSNAVTAQKAEAYQADDADNMVVNDPVAFEYGSTTTGSAVTGFTDTGNELAALYAQNAYGDGAPQDVGYERDACRLANNLVRFRTAPMMPTLHRESVMIGGNTRAILGLEPILVGPGNVGAGLRAIVVRIWCRCTSGTNVNGYVTLSRKPPYGTDWKVDSLGNKFYFFERPYQTETVVAASTTWAASSQIIFDVGIATADMGECYITVEGEPNFEYRGLAMCHVGPYVSP